MTKQILSIVAIGIVLTGFTACKGGAKRSTPDTVTVTVTTGDCCRKTDALRADLPNCCAPLMMGRTPACCKAGSAPDAEPNSCCGEAAALIEKMSACCLDTMRGKKPLPCCRGG